MDYCLFFPSTTTTTITTTTATATATTPTTTTTTPTTTANVTLKVPRFFLLMFVKISVCGHSSPTFLVYSEFIIQENRKPTEKWQTTHCKCIWSNLTLPLGFCPLFTSFSRRRETFYYQYFSKGDFKHSINILRDLLDPSL